MDSRFRAALRSEAQSLDPYVMVGHDGLTDGVVSALDEALKCHELVKVRFQAFKDEVSDMSLALAEKVNAEFVCKTGFTAVYFRENPEIKAFASLRARCTYRRNK